MSKDYLRNNKDIFPAVKTDAVNNSRQSVNTVTDPSDREGNKTCVLLGPLVNISGTEGAEHGFTFSSAC